MNGRPRTVTFVLAAVAGAYLLAALLTLDAQSGRVPALAAGTTLLLLVLEWLTRRSTTPGGDQRRAPPSDAGAGGATEGAVLASLVGLVAGVALVGFLVALPVYLYVAVTMLGGRSRRAGMLTAIATTGILWAVFELVLARRLFPGILLG